MGCLVNTRTTAAANRMSLSRYGELRALSRLLAEAQERDERAEDIVYRAFVALSESPERITDQVSPPQPEQYGFWRMFGRRFTMIETAEIEINEPFVVVDHGAGVNLDGETSRHLYAFAWERFEQALVNANALYNEKPESQLGHFNRVKEIKWEIDDLKKYIDVLYDMTAMPDELIEDDDAS